MFGKMYSESEYCMCMAEGVYITNNLNGCCSMTENLSSPAVTDTCILLVDIQ